MTSNKEDYLKVIYEEDGRNRPVSNKVISEKMGIAPASVTEMLQKLSKEGLISYEPYKGSMLSKEGLEACTDLVRGHRLWEVFLIRHLHYSWREAHEDAHLLEHITQPRMIDRLEAFLNYPETCPHGSLIPQKGKAHENRSLIRLTDLMEGETVEICRVVEDGVLLDYLERSGLRIGERVQMLSLEDYEGPISFVQKGEVISISFKAATQVYAKRCKDGKEHDRCVT